MKPRIFQSALFPAVISAALGIVAPGTVLAAYRCDHPQRFDDRRACEYAQQGLAALRRFIERTQSIYGLDFYDYIRPESTTGLVAEVGDRAHAIHEQESAQRFEANTTFPTD